MRFSPIDGNRVIALTITPVRRGVLLHVEQGRYFYEKPDIWSWDVSVSDIYKKDWQCHNQRVSPGHVALRDIWKTCWKSHSLNFPWAGRAPTPRDNTDFLGNLALHSRYYTMPSQTQYRINTIVRMIFPVVTGRTVPLLCRCAVKSPCMLVSVQHIMFEFSSSIFCWHFIPGIMLRFFGRFDMVWTCSYPIETLLGCSTIQAKDDV